MHGHRRGVRLIVLSQTLGALLCAACTSFAQAQEVAAATVDRLAKLSLEDLSAIEVTSVFKAPESLDTAPAAIFVITRDDIQRSGATHLADVLRLAPNLQIRQLTSTQFAATARGFGGSPEAQNFSNKLLMLIDGRSVYTPLFSGVYLDVQDLFLDDIERIEIISGPGSTLWGANAMNGVVNIITRTAWLAHEPSLKVAAGRMERVIAGRVGGHSADGPAWRVYAKAFERDALETETGASAQDDWRKWQTGFRVDWETGANTWTTQGDSYQGRLDQAGLPDQLVRGSNLLARWQGRVPDGQWQVQGYYDQTARDAPLGGAAFDLDTFDVEAQRLLRLGAHRMVLGVGLRRHRYHIDNGDSLLFEPSARTLDLANVFAQDTFALTRSLDLTLGLKFERASSIDWQPLPEMRLAWRVSDTLLLWGAAARAIRTPTPFDRDVVERIGELVFLTGNRDFEPEQVDAFELGYRAQPHADVSISTSVFLNDHDDLRSIEPRSSSEFLPLMWDNRMQGRTFGVEAWAKWQVTRNWRLAPGLRTLKKDLRYEDGSAELLGTAQSGNDPERQALITSSLNLGPSITFDATLRRVGRLPAPRLDAYSELSVSLGVQVTPKLDLQFSGFNLLESGRQEYPGPSGERVQRSLLGQLRWRF